MSKSLRTALLKYGISGVIAAVMVGIYVGSRDFASMDLMTKYLTLCDAFTLPGITFLMVGCLMWISNEGGLDMLSYAASKAVGLFVPGYIPKGEKYYEYVQRKRENRVTGYGFLFVVGGVCMAVALIFMYLFYQLYN